MKSSYYFDKQSVKPNTSKLQKRILDIMVPMEPMTAAPSTSDLISIGDQNHDNLVDIGTPNIIESITMSGGNGNNPLHPKGVLISECLAGVIDFPKTNEKFDKLLPRI